MLVMQLALLPFLGRFVTDNRTMLCVVVSVRSAGEGGEATQGPSPLSFVPAVATQVQTGI